MHNPGPLSIDDYISGFPEEPQVRLRQLRDIISAAAPTAAEVISYQMPAFRLNGVLVWFAAHKNHIGFYPSSSGIEAFKKELSGFKGAKGSVQFPLNQPLPIELITQIVKFRVIENLEKAASRAKKRKEK